MGVDRRPGKVEQLFQVVGAVVVSSFTSAIWRLYSRCDSSLPYAARHVVPLTTGGPDRDDSLSGWFVDTIGRNAGFLCHGQSLSDCGIYRNSGFRTARLVDLILLKYARTDLNRQPAA